MRRSAPHTGLRRRDGLSYLEVLVATFVVAVALVPAIEALELGARGSLVAEREARVQLAVYDKMEWVLHQPTGALEIEAAASGGTETSYSDPPGTDPRIVVFLRGYDGDDADGDGDPFTGADPGLVWVRVEAEHSHRALETLKAS